LRHYATNRKDAGSIPNEVIEFFSIYLIVPAALDPGVYSASNRNEYRKQKKKFLGSRALPARKTASPLSVSFLFRKCGILNISQPYRPSQPVTGITLLYITLLYETDNSN
jgi:hypothetical protein